LVKYAKDNKKTVDAAKFTKATDAAKTARKTALDYVFKTENLNKLR